MKNEFLKTLWMLRFRKLKRTEEDAAWAYQEVLDRFLSNGIPEEEVIVLLKKLVQEERSHAQMADELIRICQRTHPEVISLEIEP